MPAANSLAALMKESPLNSVILFAPTHSKLRKALDGTGTQVATCMINRWTARMNGGKGYITTEISQKKGTEKREEERRKGRRSQFLGLLKALAVKH